MIEVENRSKRYGEELAVGGLDEPTAGRVRVNGRGYRAASAPMAGLCILLEAKATHTGRTARNHLLALAQTNGVSRRRVDELIDMVGLRDVAGKRVVGGCVDEAMTR